MKKLVERKNKSDKFGFVGIKMRLGDIATFVNGYAFKPEDWGKEGLPIIRIQDLTGTSYQKNYYNGNYPDNIEINNGDVLISWSASLGIYVWDGGKALLNQHIFKVIFNKIDIDKKFFIYAVKYNLKNMITRMHGATMKHIVKNDFENIEIACPSICDQKIVAEKLHKLELIINYRKQQLEQLDLLIKARFVEMFGDLATNSKDWKESSVGDECFYIKDGPHKSLPDIGKENGGHPFISVRNIVNHTIDFSTARYISDEDYEDAIKKCHPEKGDMLYSKGGTTGIAKLIDVDEKFANWVHVAVLKFYKENLNGVFFENMLNSDYCYAQSQKLTKGIANRDLVLSSMAQIKIFMPPIELQNQFADFVNQVDKSRFKIQKSLDEAQLLFDSLMQKYFG